MPSFSSPVLIAEKVLRNTLLNAEELDLFVWSSLREWGFVPVRSRFHKPEDLNYTPSISEDVATYPDIPFIHAIVKGFTNRDFSQEISNAWADPATIAIQMGYPGHLGRASLNELVINKLLELGLYPWKGRFGAESITFSSAEGAIFPTNNPIVVEIIREFFQSMPEFNAELMDLKFGSKVQVLPVALKTFWSKPNNKISSTPVKKVQAA